MRVFKVGDKVRVSRDSLHVLAEMLWNNTGQIIEIKGPDGFHTAIVQYGPTYAIEARLGDLRVVRSMASYWSGS